jgi:hypothetical protein
MAALEMKDGGASLAMPKDPDGPSGQQPKPKPKPKPANQVATR